MKKIILSKKRKVISAVIGVTVISVGVGGFFILKSKNRVHAQVMPTSKTAQVSQGDISTTVIGTGTLQNDAALDMNVPSGITIEKVLVESGDKVEEGDVLATVDTASIASEINSVQEEIAALDEEISECQDSTDTETLTSNVEGRVKKIYAAADEDVLDIIAENGALMSLSLDGKMAVDLENAASLSQGDSVTVTDSSGDTYTGTVAGMSGSRATITVTDYNTIVDDTVTVTSSSGTTLGSGNLYIHKKLDITASSGTVNAVYVSENQSIEEDTSLLELTGTADTSEYEELLATRSNLTEKLQTLVSLSKTNEIVSEYSGIIQSVSISEGSETGSSSTGNSSDTSAASSSGQAAAMSYSGTSVKAANMMYMAGSVNTVRTACTTPAETTAPDVTEEAIQSLAAEPESGDDLSDDSTDDAAEYKTKATAITACSPAVNCPEIGKSPQDNIQETSEYYGTITWNTEDKKFQEGKAYSAVIQLTAREGYYFTQNVSIDYRSADINYLAVSSEDEGNTITFQITFPTLTKSDDSDTVNKDTSQNNTADTTDNSTASKNSDSETTNNTQNAQSGNSRTDSDSSGTSTDSGSSSSGNANSGSSDSGSSDSGSSDSGNSSSDTVSSSSTDTSASSTDKTDSTDASDVNTQLTTAFTVSPEEYMILSVEIDELDILSIALDQKASITFDALEAEEFEGTVTSISDSATTSSGGISKYTVDISIPADENMRVGMNASATIVIEEKTDVLLIPVSALQEKGDQVFVYTEEDSETGQLSGETQVETGISDGSQVEITSGLTEGQTVYYTRNESSDSSGENTEMMMPDGMGSAPGGNMGSGSAPGSMGGGRQGGQ